MEVEDMNAKGARQRPRVANRQPLRPRVWLRLPVLLGLMLGLTLGGVSLGCTGTDGLDSADATTSADGGAADGAPSKSLQCGFVVADSTGKGQRHLVDGDEVELLKGYQGYLLVQVHAHLWGRVPRTVRVKVTGQKDGGVSLDTTVPARVPTAASDQHRQTDPLEVWLSPPVPEAFVDQLGTLTLQVQGLGQSCTRKVRVRFVDKTFCVHYDDGSVACP